MSPAATAVIAPEDVLSLKQPTDGYLCPLSANGPYGIEFLRFEIKDYDSGQVVYQSPSAEQVALSSDQMPQTEEEYEALVRNVSYTFPSSFLTYKTVRTMLEFKVGPQPLDNFRMIERHYFKGQLVRTYDFDFGFCIPNSTNTWEAIYDLPVYTAEQRKEYAAHPFEHKSDSFYFVGGKLMMHNKAEYQYAA